MNRPPSSAWPHVLPLVAVSLGIFLLSHSPKLPEVSRLFSDKLLHFGAYFVHALSALWATRRAFAARRPYFWAFVISALYGASDELHQSFVRGRSSEIGDLVADAAGAAAVCLFAAWRKWP